MQFQKGMRIEIKTKALNKRKKDRVIKGKVIQSTDFLVAIKTNKGYVETFQYSDFELGRAVLI